MKLQYRVWTAVIMISGIVYEVNQEPSRVNSNQCNYFFFITKKWQGCKDEECHRESKSYTHPLFPASFSFLLCCLLNFVLIFSCSRHFAICSMVWGREEMTTNVHSLRDPRGQTVFLLTVPYIKSTEETLQCPFGTPEPIIPKGWWWGIMVSQCWILCSLV